MSATIKIKNSSTASAVPTTSDLVQGELAVNVTDKKLFTKNSAGAIVELGGIADNSVTTTKIVDSAVTTAKVADSSITNAKLSLAANASNVMTALNASGSAPIYACRAWVNFNGTGTVAIRGSGNVSSITDNGTGNYTVNFTTAMPDTSFAAVVTGYNSSGAGLPICGQTTANSTTTTTTYGFVCGTGPATLVDFTALNVAIFR